ncbi:hypothetical protein [Goodfellowiella coeruleoviolacea]|uniref:Uncharacterized protein n=1 Tax=Goodfellowiella coeruleoviolacea TaxID=334858 RepID=A0AAE3GBD9_9PSEU|nr:hypothetical protein [Goodfellowiella coeruleoviolacea]MCP2165191.1 hypothetical protein [Goodfellowiella coeruleoviolacea]
MTSRRSGRAPLLPGTGPLSKVPPAVAFVVVLGLFVLGIWVAGPIGAGLLGLLVLLLVVLLAATWRALTAGDRVIRVAAVLMLVAVAVSLLRQG